ncbi:MAG TPA: 30S ribosomal protein S11 [Candidatus Saccharimonadales bacterium]|jgi:small subunit ribosomal protein S11|nr:30S ribosomal protein S11 [Candidatus Saccharimonadales bacterium]
MAKEVKQTTPTEQAAETAVKPVIKKTKVKRIVPTGQVHIQATFNNTIVSFTDLKGNVLSSSSAGACGFRGSKKGTAYAAQVASEKAAQIAKQTYNLSKVDVFVKGIGLGRDSAIRGLQNYNLYVEAIHDVTGIPHGGVRPPKTRRV